MQTTEKQFFIFSRFKPFIIKHEKTNYVLTYVLVHTYVAQPPRTVTNRAVEAEKKQ